ncbi:MAG: ATP-binding protein [Desulfobacteraceae bacterium]|nr:ATP-binding protein [Desulfobacteraceae bacterium]
MKELIVLSGKGGTGKTTLVASLATLMPNKVLADCDVDAADLHLVLSPKIRQSHRFVSGIKAKVDAEACNACGKCLEVCQFDAIRIKRTALIDDLSCEGCGVCIHFCPAGAVYAERNDCGAWHISDTAYGTMVHAQLGIGEENSGKLVSLVKKKTREIAEAQHAGYILVDGPPGIGCPVIASLSSATLAIVVTEPTMSGLHDLKRISDLANHFKIPFCVCINKYDLNPRVSGQIGGWCRDQRAVLLGKIPFDRMVIESLVAGKPISGHDSSPAADAISDIWQRLQTAV